MMRYVARWNSWLILAGLLLAAPALSAQDTTCAYDRCALWIRDTRLMVGMPGVRLQGGSDALVRLSSRSDSALAHARRYRTASRTARNFGLGGLALLGAATGISYLQRRDWQLFDHEGHPAELALVYGGLTAGFVQFAFTIEANHSAQRAIWWYNRDLDRAPRDTSCTYDRCALWLRQSRLMVGMPGARLRDAPYSLVHLTAKSDSALFHARRYAKHAQVANGLMWGGIALMAGGLTSLALRGFSNDQPDDAIVEGIAILTGIVAEYVSIPFAFSARRSAARAVWWYNRELPR